MYSLGTVLSPPTGSFTGACYHIEPRTTLRLHQLVRELRSMDRMHLARISTISPMNSYMRFSYTVFHSYYFIYMTLEANVPKLTCVGLTGLTADLTGARW